MDGVINLNKPEGPSSARAVSQVKRLLPRGTKIGHAGTLDPFASGVLVLLVGRATKLCEALMDEPKQYDAVMKFGATTETDDPESSERPWEGEVAEIPAAALEQILREFVGSITQRPPQFSAIKVGGKRAYQLARRGSEFKLAPRVVRVDQIELLEFSWPLARLRIDCGRGTYIRSLARDIGERVAAGGYLTKLRRTRVGPFFYDEAVDLDLLGREGVAAHLKPYPAHL